MSVLQACFVAALALSAGTARVEAVTLQQMTMSQLVSASTSIVRGTVTGVSTALTNQTIFTHYTVQVEEQWKGAGRMQTVDVALPGGVLNGRKQAFPGVPALTPGKDYVLYLWSGTSAGSGTSEASQPVGMVQGIFEVTADDSGNPMAWRHATGELMVAASGKAVSDQPVSMSLSHMKSQVQAVLTGTGKGPSAE